MKKENINHCTPFHYKMIIKKTLSTLEGGLRIFLAKILPKYIINDLDQCDKNWCIFDIK